ncbi:MAG: HlyD family secretion protein, partial [Bacteroides sp.]|nr:HlyD family secretion protein [Bacteroides sp.]
ENILEVGQQFNDTYNTYQTELLTYISKLNTEISEWEQSYVFIAPISGKVNLTNYWTENQFVLAGESGLHILPLEHGELMGKAILPISRSGKVKVGQRVNIRFYNFPDNEYGIVLGKVRSIAFVPSLHTKESAYMVEIELLKGLRTSYGEELPYLPEMQAQADIVTHDLTVLQRILSPLRRVISEQKR